jgi:fructose-1,6-bisphosphatase I
MNPVKTIHWHLLEQTKLHPGASGTFSTLLSQICLACKVIGNSVNRAGLLDVLGKTGGTNIQGETVQKLDLIANAVIKEVLLKSGTVAAVVSEEEETMVATPPGTKTGPYIVHFDPLDGSSNIDANVSIGTIFAIYRKKSEGSHVTEGDVLQPGKDLVGAGYVVYGSSTMLVYSAGHGVHGFTYDPSCGEFLLSHPDIRIPDVCTVYSANESRMNGWPPGARAYVEHIKTRENPRYRTTTARYIGSLVADAHRNLLYGGIFMYPETAEAPKGRLRLMYEAAPLSFIIEQAGGLSSTGSQSILNITPTSMHQRVPLIMGNRVDVELYEKYLQAEGT